MIFVIAIASIYVFFKGISYSFFEFKNNKNKLAGSLMIILSIISLIGPTWAFYIR